MPTGARLHLDSVNLIRLELAANACPIPRVPGISEELLLSEIAYALHPHLHEQRIAPYGVVALSESFEFFPVSRRITLAEIDIDSMRQLADGRVRSGHIGNNLVQGHG